jgi:proline dehydrogenase
MRLFRSGPSQHRHSIVARGLMSLMRSVLLAASQNPWLRDRATRSPLVRRAVTRFMPGESLEAAIAATRYLGGRGLGTILTHLGENLTQRSEAQAVTAHYLEVLDRVHESQLDAEVSVKLTQLGLDLDPALACEGVRTIARRAQELGNRVWIDMEDSHYTDRTLELFRAVRSSHSNVGVCLQTYLRRTPADLESLLPLGPAIRLVKGAYREPAPIAFPRKRDVDENFFTLSARLLGPEARNAGAKLTVGTHDLALIDRVRAHAAALRVPRDGFEVAMLYGIQREAQLRIAREGARTRVLISYGSSWFPWYMRRLAERPANLLFVARNVFGG